LRFDWKHIARFYPCDNPASTWNNSGQEHGRATTPDEIIRNLDTTSAKIRALAQAGHDRTEISQHLGIRYQHVRKVLLDAGITAGLRRQVEAEREPVLVDAALGAPTFSIGLSRIPRSHMLRTHHANPMPNAASLQFPLWQPEARARMSSSEATPAATSSAAGPLGRSV